MLPAYGQRDPAKRYLKIMAFMFNVEVSTVVSFEIISILYGSPTDHIAIYRSLFLVFHFLYQMDIDML